MKKSTLWLAVTFAGVTMLTFISLVFGLTTDTLLGCLAGTIVGTISAMIIAIRGQQHFALQAFALCTLAGGVFQLGLLLLLMLVRLNLISLAAMAFDLFAGLMGGVFVAVVHITSTKKIT